MVFINFEYFYVLISQNKIIVKKREDIQNWYLFKIYNLR